MNNYVLKATKEIYPDFSLRETYNSFVFISKCIAHYRTIAKFISSIKESHYGHVLFLRPSVLGFVIWPYIHNEWAITKRFEAILTHYQLLNKLPKYLDVSDGTPRNILDLSHYSENLSIVLDRSKWFLREGEITANVFKNDLRVMSIVFSFGYSEKGLTIYIGCVQGIHAGVSSEESLEILKNLTKNLEGLRPRNFLFQIVQMIGASVGVKAIRGISEHNRQHHHQHYKNYLANHPSANYDEIWLDVNGVKREDGFFELPVNPHRRDLATIASKKRAAYRRRYLMMDNINDHIISL
jgi:uncharacterized protein VirK/YbjX